MRPARTKSHRPSPRPPTASSLPRGRSSSHPFTSDDAAAPRGGPLRPAGRSRPGQRPADPGSAPLCSAGSGEQRCGRPGSQECRWGAALKLSHLAAALWGLLPPTGQHHSPLTMLQDSPREAFDFWVQTLERAYETVEVGAGRAACRLEGPPQGQRDPQAALQQGRWCACRRAQPLLSPHLLDTLRWRAALTAAPTPFVAAGTHSFWIKVRPAAAAHPLPLPALQEYERRFLTWLDNLRFVHDYNARHSSHWVSAAVGAGSAGGCLFVGSGGSSGEAGRRNPCGVRRGRSPPQPPAADFLPPPAATTK